MRHNHIPPVVREALEATGLPWSVEIGGRHFKVKLNGRVITILPMGSGSSDPRANKNVVSYIRQAHRKFLQESKNGERVEETSNR